MVDDLPFWAAVSDTETAALGVPSPVTNENRIAGDVIIKRSRTLVNPVTSHQKIAEVSWERIGTEIVWI